MEQLNSIEDIFPLHLLEEISTNGGKKIGIVANAGGHTAELLGGIVLAVKNRNNRTAVELVWKMEERSKEGGLEAAAYFHCLDVPYVIGHLSATTAIYAAEYYNAHNILFFAPGTSHPSLIKEDYKFVFRVCGRDDHQAQAIVLKILELNCSHVTMLSENIEYGRALSGLIAGKLNNFDLSYSHYFLDENLLEREHVYDETAKAQTSIVLFVGRYEQGAEVVRELIVRGFTGNMLMSDDCLILPFINAVKGLPNDIYVSKMKLQEKFSDVIGGLDRQYFNLTGKHAGAYFYTSYTAMNILLDALNAKNDVNVLSNTIKNSAKNTVIGNLSYLPDGEIEGINWEIIQLKDINL
jgi:branched-chain amino acid transport system substrate-binding protein